MRHPSEGVLRRLVDDPAGVGDADRIHVAGCDECGRALAAIREDAVVLHTVLATDAGADVDLGTAWHRLSTAAATGEVRSRTVVPARARGLRAAFRRPVVASVAAAVVLAGAGTAAANDWLPIFQTEKVEPVSLTTADLNALPDLRAYGDVAVTGNPEVHPVTDAPAAAAESGLDVPKVSTLPRGVTGQPTYQVGREVSVTFTFSAERAARAAARAGETLPPPPPGMDGSQVRLVAGPGVAAVWSRSGGIPDLVVGRAVPPRAFSSAGVGFETMRDYLLSLPGLPKNVATTLRTFNADGSTLPLPFPSDRMTTASADIDGDRATVLASRDRSMAAVVWVGDGVMTVVAGSLDADEVVAVARGLR